MGILRRYAGPGTAGADGRNIEPHKMKHKIQHVHELQRLMT